MSETYLTTDEVARHYRMMPATIRQWRSRGTGPRGVKVGKKVLYTRAEIDRYDARLAKLAEREASERGGDPGTTTARPRTGSGGTP